MSYNAPNPDKPGHYTPHATVVPIDGVTGYPAGHPSASPQKVLSVNEAGDVVGDPGTKVTAVAALGAGGTGIIGWLSQIWAALAGVLRVEPLGQPGESRPTAATTTSANKVLTTTCRRISITAEGCKMRYAVGNAVQTAIATTSHMIRDGERLDIAVPLNGNIAVIRDSAATADGVLEISELI